MTQTLVPDAPFHRLGTRDRRGRAWLSLLFVVGAIVGAGAIALTVVAGWGLVAGDPSDGELFAGFGSGSSLTDVVIAFGSVAVLLPIILLAVRLVQERPAGSLSSVTGRVRWGWLGRCLAVAVPAIGLVLAGAYWLAPDDGTTAVWVGWERFALSAALLLPVVAAQSAAEEYVFRGWLLQAFGNLLRNPVVPIVVQALLFAALHGWGTPWGFVDLTWFGVLAGWLCVRTGGIEAAVALHVANNGVMLAVAAATGLLSVDQTAADMPWQVAAVSMTVTTAYTLVVLAWSRRRGLAVRSAPAPAAEPALALAA
ncbi:CPBP family intramembrane glutamic endopeptidase [Spirilliplanes yamanashiensis]|uniref:CAAX prenyl protease 2/Lysostaphin resistance protein A-like domain-containing protein n=1 Tax=Spirilliplanes yamanashiensis TaxID=42233 RepID=A0A8J3Y7R9_9ACTN|nr:CPBP family intramembrane glutamic endopeptidase [Spirilliplanes yamanashiensis]MDP9817487.1 membrane protease YdiL (CAAX protease family) [Spirilliplanes yamanashiensis]GIJ02860.1 hypothetical protein Sya03_22120 [Spirilliplanes yamanashiensis]